MKDSQKAFPTKAHDFKFWLSNVAKEIESINLLLASYTNAAPLTSTETAIIISAAADYEAAYTKAIFSSTRTTVTIGDRNTMRKTVTASVRPLFNILKKQLVLLVEAHGVIPFIPAYMTLGIPLPGEDTKVISMPKESPWLSSAGIDHSMLKLRYRGPRMLGTGRSLRHKPPGVSQVRITAVFDNNEKVVKNFIRNPITLQFEPQYEGRNVTLYAQWIGANGEESRSSNAVSAVVPLAYAAKV